MRWSKPILLSLTFPLSYVCTVHTHRQPLCQTLRLMMTLLKIPQETNRTNFLSRRDIHGGRIAEAGKKRARVCGQQPRIVHFRHMSPLSTMFLKFSSEKHMKDCSSDSLTYQYSIFLSDNAVFLHFRPVATNVVRSLQTLTTVECAPNLISHFVTIVVRNTEKLGTESQLSARFTSQGGWRPRPCI